MRLFSLSICLLLSIPLIGQFDLFEKKEFICKNGDRLPYRILYPENYNESDKYPLVLFLHGAGERGNDNEKQLVHGVKTFLNPAHRSKYPCIVIAPQCPSDSYWASAKYDRTSSPVDFDYNYSYEMTDGFEMAMELTKSIIKKEAVDKKRVYITGLSMGGMGTFEAVGRYPRLFAAAAPVCGGGDSNAYGKKQSKVSFWIFHGDADQVVPVENSRQMHQRLKNLKTNVKYTEYPGVGHNSWDHAYTEEKLLSWLFAH